MAVTSSTGRSKDLQMLKKWKERETSPERTKIWTEPSNNKHKAERKVPVVYYLYRSGHLEQPHFMEVPLSSSSQGLYLRDVISRLNFLRGKGMAALYSWSSKRSYKNGFVWHDLDENDFIYPAHGQEYVLKGSKLLDVTLISKPDETVSSSSEKTPPESRKSGNDFDSLVVRRRRNQSWSTIDLHEYKVFKADSPGEAAGTSAADASTQTDDKRRRRRTTGEVKEEHREEKSTELSRDEISPPPSDSSQETLESLMKADGGLALRSGELSGESTASNHPSGRFKASSVLLQLISCGSISFRDYGPDAVEISLISNKERVPHGGGSNQVEEDVKEDMVENPSFGSRIKVDDKKYFSESLIETKKDEFPGLKRSST